MEKALDISSNDIEARSEESGHVSSSINPRVDIPAWQWILILVVLYLGALLYGSHRFSASLTGQNSR